MPWFDEDENRLIPTFIKAQHFYPMVEEGVMVFANSCGIWNEEDQEKYTPTKVIDKKKLQGGLPKITWGKNPPYPSST